MQRDRFYSVSEVQQILGLGRNVVVGLLTKGELKGAKLGTRQWRILGSDILAYYERRKEQSGQKGGEASE